MTSDDNEDDKKIAPAMPERLEPKNPKSSLLQNVRGYFYALYNAGDKSFQKLLASTGNKNAIHGNRLFDRQHAVTLIIERAKRANDEITQQATEGEIYKCVTKITRQHPELNPKVRELKYKKLQAAE